ncbi:hypothetical protein ACFE04_010939 [Oxalis oulophora]
MASTCLGRDTKIVNVMRNKVWYLPRAENEVVANAWRQILTVEICRDGKDKIIWLPGFSVTRHGKVERVSSREEPSGACCFGDDNLLLLTFSSPPALLLPLGKVELLGLEPWDRGHTATT